MEMFALSKRELEAKFTKSEMVLLAWRSQETSYLMDQSIKEGSSEETTVSKKKRSVEGAPADLPDHFFNEDGEVDLRRVTGQEAYKYMQSIGIQLPIMKRD
jgi:hypothetical protein